MKHGKMIVLLIMSAVLLSGCTSKSNVIIKTDGSVEEKVTVLVNTVSLKNDEHTIKQMIENIILDYAPAIKFRGYQHEVVEGNDLSGAEFSKKYKSVCSYFSDTGFNQYVYHHVKCSEDENNIIIENDTDYIPYCPDCSDWPALKNVEFNLTLPVKAVENNADSVNDNVYTWRFNESTPSNKKFYIKISKSELNESFIKEQKDNKTKLIMKIVIIVLIIAIVFGLLGFLVKVLYKKYKNNQIEY